MSPAIAIEPLPEPPDVLVRVPGSKSFTNRALVCAAMAEGRSRLTGVLMADDTEAMVDGVRTLGATVEVEDAGGLAPVMVVGGTGGALAAGPATIDARQSGTTARFLAAVVCRGDDAYRIDGDDQLKARPMGSLFQALRGLGASVIEEAAPGHLPVAIRGGWRADQVEVAGDISSQYLSALLLAAPGRPDGLRVDLTTPLVSRPFAAMTATTMAAFGAEVTVADTWCRVGPPPYVACDYDIEPDASAASYFFAAAALTGGRVEVDGLPPSSRQGDLGIVDLLARMGAEVERGTRSVAVRGTGILHGIHANLADTPDMVPTLAAVAAFANSPSEISGVGFVRHHESDRLAAVVDALGRCGVEVHEEPDGLLIVPNPKGPTGAVIDPHSDHRMAMAFALVGLRVPGVVIEGAECVAKTFPDYFTVLEGLRRR